MFRSIRARMTALFAISAVLLIGAVCVGLVTYAHYNAERNAAIVLGAAGAKITRELDDEHESIHIGESMNEAVEDMQAENVSAFLVTNDGRIIGSSRRVSPAHAPINGKDWRTHRLRVGDNWLIIAMPWTKTAASLRSLAESLTVLGFFVVILITIGAWILVGRTLSPIGLLSHQANAVTVENLQVRLNEPSQDSEIVGLVATLNGLLSRLSEAAAAKGRFYSAASHELRTPLQALSGHLELALNKDRSNEEYRTAIEEAYAQTRRLIKLTRSLLMLYQLDASSDTPPVEPVDLIQVCRHILSQFEPLIEQRGLQVRTDLPASTTLAAPPAHADVLVRNLIENAVRYAERGGDLSIDIKTLPTRLEMGIRNQCADLDEWDPDKLFQPFARLDPSRNSATGGTGLGLAICRSIADVNGWAISIEKTSGGVLATLVIPCSKVADVSATTE